MGLMRYRGIISSIFTVKSAVAGTPSKLIISRTQNLICAKSRAVPYENRLHKTVLYGKVCF